MKLLTFLGTGTYGETEYALGEQRRVTCYAPVASCTFLRPAELVVFATQEAEAAHGAALQGEAGLPTHFVRVPKGQNTDELWTIFRQVAEAVAEGEQVAFDVTHGLRSFPLIGLLAAAFLRAARRVDVIAVLYGAYDVRDQSVTPNRTPMFDLSPMLTLLEWAVAAERFNRAGDARDLASLVKAQRKSLAENAGGDPVRLEQVGRLGNLAGTLENISQALRLIRPYQAMRAIAGLPERIEQARPALQQTMAALPFTLVLDDVARSYAPLAHPQPDTTGHLKRTLEVERGMIHWYAEREQWVQAIALAREWLVSWVMYRLGITQLTQLSERQKVETVVGAEATEWVNAQKNKQAFASTFLLRLPCLETVLSLWHPLTQTRNDALHAGMREDPGRPENLIAQIQSHLRVLDGLPLE